MKVYFDNAATTQLESKVMDLMFAIMKDHYGNPSSIHANGRKAKSIIEEARKKVARIMNASVGEIFFTGSATEANNTIINGCVNDLGVKTIISSPIEHDCVLRSLERVAAQGIHVNYLKLDKNGDISLDELKEYIESGKKIGKVLVSLMHGNNEIGNLNDVKSIASICKESSVLFHSDMVQTVGKYKIDLQNIGLSFMAASAHKFHGPKGCGFFYMNTNNIIRPMIVGGAQERNLRSGTENTYGIAGLAEALQLYEDKQVENYQKLVEIRDYFESQLTRVAPEVLVNAKEAKERLPNISSISFPPSPKAELLVFNLDINGISVSSGSACSSGIEQDSHVLQAIGHDGERKTIRFSFSHFNDKDEVDYVVATLVKLLSK